MTNPKIIAFSGSTRTSSLNQQLVDVAKGRLENLGVTVTSVSLADYPMPIYDGDLEDASGIPETAQQFYELLKDHDGMLIGCPEYNSSITPLLKNAIDWASRPRPNDPPLVAFQGKICGLVAAAPGPIGGIRGLRHVASILTSIGTIVVPPTVALGNAMTAMKDGAISDQRSSGLLDNLVAQMKRFLG
ncbi:MAG: NAD(P)H-dependent oxidoreductase [Pirellulaceae bacterium]